MSNQVQIFWDPHLKTFVLEVPNPNSPSAPPPTIVSPEDFQAPPTKVATFIRDPNAPLGSFGNPIPHPSAIIQWQPDPSAPLGTYGNAHPYLPQTPVTSAAASPAPSIGPTHPYIQASQLASILTNPISQANLDSNPAVSDPQAHAQPTGVGPTTTQASSTHTGTSNPQSTPRQESGPESRSRSRSRGRHVRFADAQTRIRANAEAAAEANLRALEDERETREYIDTHAPMPRRRPPTPMPPRMSGGWVPHPTSFGPQSETDPRANPVQSRSSSTASTVDPLSTYGAPIPAAPSRNPDFRDPRRNGDAMALATIGLYEEAENSAYETWPSCAMCEDRPATVVMSGVKFCAGCFGQALAAEERSRGRRRERK
ncbi:MAG: hypothetical protein Q9172_002053 [Xanthocarpia lactea]